MIRYFCCLLLFASCSSRASMQSATNQNALEEVRIALVDVRQAFSSQQMEIQILEEKVNRLKPTAQPKTGTLEARLQHLEKTIERVDKDLHQFSSYANQTTQSLIQYRNQINLLDTQLKQQSTRLDEIAKLNKSTLNSISQAISSKSTNSRVHKVCPGDSLGKIAKDYNTTIDALKKANGLSGNTILAGQELKIPE